MRKFYTIIAAAAITVSASAAYHLNSPAAVRAWKAPVAAFEASNPTLKAGAKVDAQQFIAAELLEAPAKEKSAKVPSLSEWKTMDGTAKYTDDFFTVFEGIGGETYEVTVEQNTDTDGYYRLVNPYKEFAETYGFEYDDSEDHYIYLHGESADGYFYIEPFETGVTLSDTYANIAVSDQVSAMVSSYGYSMVQSYYPSGFGTVSDGVYTYGAFLSTSSGTYYNFLLKSGGTSGTTLSGTNLDGNFKVVLPGSSDYSVELTAPACAGETAVLSFKLGSDVYGVAAKAYAQLTSSDDYTAAYTDLFSADDSVVTFESGTLSVPLTNEGTNSVVYCAFNSSGTVVDVNYTDVLKVSDDADQWQSLGNGQFTDIYGYIMGFADTMQTYDVEVQQNIATPTLYRTVNAYVNENVPTAYSYYNEAAELHADHNHYIVYDVTDPEAVTFGISPVGLNWGSGEVYLCNTGYFFVDYAGQADKATAQSSGYYGTYDEASRTISFGAGSIIHYNEAIGGWYYTSSKVDNGSLVLPDPAGVDAIQIDNASAPVEYFNLQGVRVENPSNGLFIRRQGTAVSKTVIK